MMLLGMIWAVFAPLLLLVAIMLARRRLRPHVAGHALPVAAALVLLPVAGVWGWQRSEFSGICRGEGAAVVRQHAHADGFLLDSGTANSFGRRYLDSDGFAWFEARDIYRRDGWVRYERGTDGQISTRAIDQPTARYEVRETHETPRAHTSLSVTRVVDRETGTEMARASRANFDGGTMKWVLGAWGSAHCPNAMWNSEGFRRYYDVVRDTLR